MYVVIIGCGRLGSFMAREFSNEGHDVAIVDSDRDRLDVLGKGFNGNRILGIEYDDDVLTEAGIQKADVFFAVCPDDNKNITASLIAKDFYKVPRVIARISSPDKESIYKKLDIEAVNPTTITKSILKEKIMPGGLKILDWEKLYNKISRG